MLLGLLGLRHCSGRCSSTDDRCLAHVKKHATSTQQLYQYYIMNGEHKMIDSNGNTLKRADKPERDLRMDQFFFFRMKQR